MRLEFLHEGALLRIAVEDEGRGLPEGFELGKTESLGFKLVDMLAGQLEGKMTIRSGKGLRVEVSLPFTD